MPVYIPKQSSVFDINVRFLYHCVCFINWCYPVSLPPDSALSTVRSQAERGFILPWEFTSFLQKCNSMSSWVIGNMISQESCSLFCNVLWPFHRNTSTNSAFCYCLPHRWGQVMSPSASHSPPLSKGKTTFTSPEEKHYLELDLIISFKLTFFSAPLASSNSVSLCLQLCFKTYVSI